MGWTQLAGILVDTDNLASGCARDKELARSMLVGAGSMGRNGFYNHCKHFTSGLHIMFKNPIYTSVFVSIPNFIYAFMKVVDAR